MQKSNKKQNIRGLLGLLAVDSAQDVNTLLSKNGISPSNDPNELANKLAALYQNAPDKLIIEKQFAAIHPHKNFILKYNSAPSGGESMVKAANVKIADDQETKQLLRQFISTAAPTPEFSNCEGNPNCNCKQRMSNACGCSGFSGFDAQGVQMQLGRSISNNKELIIGGLVLVTVIGLFLHYKK